MRKLLALCVFLSGAFAAPEKRRNVVQVKMRRVPSELAHSSSLQHIVDKLGELYGGNGMDDADMSLAADLAKQTIRNYDDMYYRVDINLGTPAQPFTVLLDTGSANTWVIDSSCHSGDCSERKTFDSAASSTFTKTDETIVVPFTPSTANVSLMIVYDSLDLAGLQIDSQGFGAATGAPGTYGTYPVDGVLGLGWPGLAEGDIVPPMQNLLGQLDQPIFTIFMAGHERAAFDTNDGGFLTLGGYDHDNCNDQIDYAPLTEKLYWQFKMDSFVAGTIEQRTGVEAYLNSGSFSIGVPTEFYERMFTSIAKLKLFPPCEGDYPDLVFTINKIEYVVPPSQYIRNIGAGKNHCWMFIVPVDNADGPQWYLGDPFLRQFCTVYDIGQEQVGIAHHSVPDPIRTTKTTVPTTPFTGSTKPPTTKPTVPTKETTKPTAPTKPTVPSTSSKPTTPTTVSVTTSGAWGAGGISVAVTLLSIFL